MELVSLAKQMAHSVAETAAGYRLGQSALRHLDRALWIVEKCAKWAVPPPLDQDERPQPELVRPLPWVLFLMMLVALRVTRESISLFNLVLGKPPLRSADVVMYLQSKRRYLRTLKYQGSRQLRARGSNKQPWYRGLYSLLEFTMCFRRSHNYGNNNTTQISNNEEVLVVKRTKRPREPAPDSPASNNEATMERLIERMMTELDVDSGDDSSYTLTNPTSPRSDRSEYGTGSEDDTLENLNASGNSVLMSPDDVAEEKGEIHSSTPEKEIYSTPLKDPITPIQYLKEKKLETVEKNGTNEEIKDDIEIPNVNNAKEKSHLEAAEPKQSQNPKFSPKKESKNFLQYERYEKSLKSPKFVNGRLNTSSKKDRSPKLDPRK